MSSPEEDREMLNNSLLVLQHTLEQLRALPLESADKDESKKFHRKDGKDTRRFDVVAEQAIAVGTQDHPGHRQLLKQVYGNEGFIITEESGRIPKGERILRVSPVIVSDPVDRSSYLEDRIRKAQKEAREGGKRLATLGELFDAERARLGEERARLESCNGSVTLLKDQKFKYTVVLNYFTGEVFVASEDGVFSGNLPSARSLDDITRPVRFRDVENLNIVFYNKPGKYEENRLGTHLRFFSLDESIRSPGGPNRFTHLLEDAASISDIGVIAHNGEKIQESLPNIAIAYFSQGALAAYKLFCDRAHKAHRAGKRLTPVLKNSIYERGLIEHTGIDVVFLNNHEYPSEFRDTTVITPVSNDAAMTLMTGMVERGYATRIV